MILFMMVMVVVVSKTEPKWVYLLANIMMGQVSSAADAVDDNDAGDDDHAGDFNHTGVMTIMLLRWGTPPQTQ